MNRLTTISCLTNKHDIFALTLNTNVTSHCYCIQNAAFLTSRSLYARRTHFTQHREMEAIDTNRYNRILRFGQIRLNLITYQYFNFPTRQTFYLNSSYNREINCSIIIYGIGIHTTSDTSLVSLVPRIMFIEYGNCCLIRCRDKNSHIVLRHHLDIVLITRSIVVFVFCMLQISNFLRRCTTCENQCGNGHKWNKEFFHNQAINC